MTPIRRSCRAAMFCIFGSLLVSVGCRGSGTRVKDPDGKTEADGPRPSACKPHAATGAEPSIDDFDGTEELPTNDGRAGRWLFYDDGTAGQRTADLAKEDSVLHVSSRGFTRWGSGFGVTLAPDSTQTRSCPYDASAHGGFSFRLRGEGRVRFRVGTPETTPVAEGGKCTLPGERCYDWAGAWVSLEPGWRTYTFPFCKLKAEGWSGAPVPLDPKRISALHFMLEGKTELWLDALAFTPLATAAPGACADTCPLDAAPPQSVAPKTTTLALTDSLSLHTFEQGTTHCGPIERRYLSMVPQRLGENSNAPVVVTLHGSGANAESFQHTMAHGGLDALAERDGFIVIHGNAAPGDSSRADLLNSGSWRQDHFDDGEVDDVEYLEGVLADLARRGVISGDNPLFLMGLSNGGGMALDAARRWPERISGFAAFMAFDGFKPKAIPELESTSLRRVLFGYAPGDPGLPTAYSDDVLARLPREWARALGLSSESLDAPKVRQLPDQVKEGADYTGNAAAALATRDSRATRLDYGAASDARRVSVFVFENAGHFWPNPAQDSEEWILERWGLRNQDVDASAEAWEFFREALRR